MTGAQQAAGLLLELDGATARLLATVDQLTVEDVAAPSALPGWSRAHVLAHLARNAESHQGMAEGAARGEVVAQYAGGREQRARDIEASAARPAAEVLASVRPAAEALSRAWHSLPEDAWDNLIGRSTGPTEAWRGLQARLLEVEVHHADLAAGYSWRDWPASFAAAELDAAAGRIARAASAAPGVWTVVCADGPGEWRFGSGQAAGRISGGGTALLAWLLGRASAEQAGLVIDGDWTTGAELPQHYPYG